MSRTKKRPQQIRRGRLSKAAQFLDAARTIEDLASEGRDVGDAFVTLCVHAGIAASDVVCCAVLGEHAHGENHNEAVALLNRADPSLSTHLRTLLALKTDAGYSHMPTSTTDHKRAWRAATALVDSATKV